MKRAPFTRSSSSGVSTSTVPIFAALGQPAPGAENAVSLASWASLQTSSPSAIAGLVVKPSGRVTSTLRIWDLARAPSSFEVRPSSSISSEKSRPAGLDAALDAGSAGSEGGEAGEGRRPGVGTGFAFFSGVFQGTTLTPGNQRPPAVGGQGEQGLVAARH